MKSTVSIWQFVGFGVSTFLGTLLHFAYNFFGKSKWIAPFAAVNESTWEHMKLLFFPMLLFAIIEYFFIGKDFFTFWCVKAWGMLLGIWLIPLLFYTLGGIFGTLPALVNIGIFFVSAGIAYLYETKALQQSTSCMLSEPQALLLLGVVAMAFVLFTFFAPHIPLFRDPLTHTYGIVVK